MKKPTAKKTVAKQAAAGDSPSRLIDARIRKLGDGVHFQIEDDGVLPNGGTDGGHHNEATAMANMAITNYG